MFRCDKASLNTEEPIIETTIQKELTGHADSITCVAWNFDRSMFATGGMDGVVHVWNDEGELIVQLQGPADSIEVNEPIFCHFVGTNAIVVDMLAS